MRSNHVQPFVLFKNTFSVLCISFSYFLLVPILHYHITNWCSHCFIKICSSVFWTELIFLLNIFKFLYFLIFISQHVYAILDSYLQHGLEHYLWPHYLWFLLKYRYLDFLTDILKLHMLLNMWSIPKISFIILYHHYIISMSMY